MWKCSIKDFACAGTFKFHFTALRVSNTKVSDATDCVASALTPGGGARFIRTAAMAAPRQQEALFSRQEAGAELSSKRQRRAARREASHGQMASLQCEAADFPPSTAAGSAER